MDYCLHKINQRREQENYQIYVTDAIAAILRRWSNGPVPRYYDLIHPQPEDTRTGKEIADDIIARLGLKVVD